MNAALAVVDFCEGTIIFDASTNKKSYNLTREYVLGFIPGPVTKRKAAGITYAYNPVYRDGTYDLSLFARMGGQSCWTLAPPEEWAV